MSKTHGLGTVADEIVNQRQRRQNGDSEIAPAPARFQAHHDENLSAGEAWLSLAAGAGLMLGAWQSWSKRSFPLAAAGASLLYRGSTRHCPLYSAAGVDHSSHNNGPDAISSATVQASVHDLYELWRDLSNAPQFMSFVDEVEVVDEQRSIWKGSYPGGKRYEYRAEIFEDSPDHGFRWRSVTGSPVQMRGSVRFKPAPADRGAIVIASIVFGAPASGKGLPARLLAPFANYKIHRDLLRFKQLVETGEIATTEGQPSGREQDSQQDRRRSASQPHRTPTYEFEGGRP